MNRLLIRYYDSLMRESEEACLRDWRAQVLAETSGTVLEIGAGTGANLPLYSTAVERLVITEPNLAMRRLLQEKTAQFEADVEVVDSSAESLPFDSGTFDAVTCTLVLCSVNDPRRSVSEIARVLKPGGTLHFIEHIAAATGSKRHRWQRRVEPIWKRLMGNCHLTRDTETTIRGAGFELEWSESASIRKAFALTRPSIRGVAVLR